jgi:hypothetical protein
VSDLGLERLERDGLIRRRDDRWVTTRRWQGAMARAAYRLAATGEELTDLRLPIAFALVELYGDLADDALTELIHAMLPVEQASIAPAGAIAGTAP